MRTAQTERVRHIAWLTDELVQNSAVLEQAGANVAAGAKKCAGLKQRGQSVTNCYCLAMSRDQALEQAQSALRTTSRAAGADERSRRELAEMHAKLEARVSEFVAVRLRLMDAEGGWSKSKADADATRCVPGLRLGHGLSIWM